MPARPERYLVAGCRPWARRAFNDVIRRFPGRWTYVEHREKLSPRHVGRIDPSYIFFLHWSWRVPEELLNRYTCIGFHMTDLPYGRGGTPLQNLILRGHRTTKLTAFRMTEDWDAGAVYLKEKLRLHGSANDVYLRSARLAARMIRRITRSHPSPRPQVGRIVRFRRRRPDESAIPKLHSFRKLYDWIRMLDAEGYPRAFLDHQGFRYEFRNAKLTPFGLKADVTITRPDPHRS
jgi:methionyl-tRNA formyltransferase